MKGYTLDSIIEDAKESLDEWGLEEGDDPDDAITEVADGAVPVYHSDLLDVAANSNEVALSEPDFPAFDGTATPINIIAANIYEAVTAALHAHWRDKDWGDDDEKD